MEAGDAEPEVLRAARLTRARVALALSQLAALPDLLTSQDAAQKALAGVDMTRFCAGVADFARADPAAAAVVVAGLSPCAPAFAGARLRLRPDANNSRPGARRLDTADHRGDHARKFCRDQTAPRPAAGRHASRLRRGRRPVVDWLARPAVRGAAARGRRRPCLCEDRLPSDRLCRLGHGAARPASARSVSSPSGRGAPRRHRRRRGRRLPVRFPAPQWERHGAPGLAKGFLGALRTYADRALRWDGPEQDYRLARKDLMEAFSALGESAARMRADPESPARRSGRITAP